MHSLSFMLNGVLLKLRDEYSACTQRVLQFLTQNFKFSTLSEKCLAVDIETMNDLVC
jgi:hypothetical protein